MVKTTAEDDEQSIGETHMTQRNHINLKANEIIAGAENAKTVDEVNGYKSEFEFRLAKNKQKLADLAEGKNPKGLEEKIKHLSANIAKLEPFAQALAPKTKSSKPKAKVETVQVHEATTEMMTFLTGPASQKSKLAFIKALSSQAK